MDVKELLSGLD
ncbi:BH3464 [Halalkalibacterium halodurans C-125]|uniref:BH3464 protein n=1 Tax=Halalkalibacterium halodurans (strain ATCC BAA-125 / DSM 18197 / FERM 7344 / JCM 9153 / C-125) TaxID=272558 RepID=Q9K7A4_HALH5|nr:BH3464 [Halalkalibacterium halodurans C-125]